MGNITPEDNPQQYLSCINDLIEYYDEHFRGKVPLVINTQGWIQGAGYRMLLSIITEARPTDIIQICKHEQCPLKFADVEAIGLTVKPRNLRSSKKTINTNHETCVIHTVKSVKVPGPCITNTPAEDRTLRILSYFKASIGNTGMTYTVPWNKVGIKFLTHIVPPSQALWALNGSIVALGTCSALFAKKTEVNYSEYPIILAPSQLNEANKIACIGLGVIKSIDPDQRKITIVTPIPFNLLSNVNVLLKGNIETPSMLLFLMESGVNTPYISTDSVASKYIGGSTKKRKRYVSKHVRPRGTSPREI